MLGAIDARDPRAQTAPLAARQNTGTNAYSRPQNGEQQNEMGRQAAGAAR